LHFCNAIGIGASVDVSREMSSNEKARFGVMAYARAVWRVLGRSSGFRVTVTGEGLQHAGRAVQVTIANGVHYGGGMTVHETAAIDDGQLDALIVRPRSVMEYLRHFFAFKFGRFSGHAPVSIGRSPHITVTTTRPRACALDGEVRTQTPLEVSVLAAALEILVPAASERGTT
jgi:diacylglycerol kinase family enzyme